MKKNTLSARYITIILVILITPALCIFFQAIVNPSFKFIDPNRIISSPSATSAGTNTPDAYPFPPPYVYYPPPTDQPRLPTLIPTPTSTITPTPTLLPGQPTATRLPTMDFSPARTVTPFFTPVYPTKSAINPPGGLQKLWYPYSAAGNSAPLLQIELIDALAQHRGKGDITVDLELDPKFPGPFLTGLYPSPDGKWIVAATVFGEVTQPYLNNPTTGKASRILPDRESVRFLGWNLESHKIIVNNNPFEPWNVGELDISSGVYRALEFPQADRALPVVLGVEYASNGNFLAEALIYQPTKTKKYCLFEVGLRNIKTQDRTTLIDIPSACVPTRFSLKWSVDGRFLAWIIDETSVSNPVLYSALSKLWISDRVSGEIKTFTTLGQNITYVNPPVWSTDNKLAVVKYDEKDKKYARGNIFLIDPLSGAETQISHFTQKIVSNLQWSTDGKWIYCTVSDDASGAIWAVNIDGVTAFPVAGPVIANWPFAILP